MPEDQPPAARPDSFDRIWRDLSDLARRHSRVLTTKTGRSEYLLALSPRGVMLKSLQGLTDRSFSRDAIRRLWKSSHVLGAPSHARPTDLKHVMGAGRDAHYLWAVYAEMWRLDERRSIGSRSRR